MTNTIYYNSSTLKRFATIRRNKRQEEIRARIGMLLIIGVLAFTMSSGIKKAIGSAEFQPFFTAGLFSISGSGGVSSSATNEDETDKPSALPEISFYDAGELSKQANLSQNQRQINELASKVGYKEIEVYIRQTAREYKIDENLFLKIATCENTNLMPHLKNPISGCTAMGIFQFVDSTWKSGIKRRGLDWNLSDKKDYKKNVDMAAWFIAQGEISHWAASNNCHHGLD